MSAEERRWRLAALDDLVGWLVLLGRMLHMRITDVMPTGTLNVRRAPLLLERIAAAVRSLARVAVLIRAGVAYQPRQAGASRSGGSGGGQREPRMPPSLLSLMSIEMPQYDVHLGFLRSLLAESGVSLLLATDPRVERVMRPLCRMLGVNPDRFLYPMPPREPIREPEPEPEAPWVPPCDAAALRAEVMAGLGVPAAPEAEADVAVEPEGAGPFRPP